MSWQDSERDPQVERFVESLSVIGAPIIVNRRASKVRRLVWLVMVLGGAVVAVYNIHMRLSRYIADPVTVNIQIERPSAVFLPSVSLCAAHFFSPSFLAAVSEHIQTNITAALTNSTSCRGDLTECLQAVPDITFPPDMLDMLITSSSHRLSETSFCTQLSNDREGLYCNSTHTEIEVGQCLSVDGDKHRVRNPGIIEALYMMRNDSFSEMINLSPRTLPGKITYFVFVHPPGLVSMFFSPLIMVAPGLQTQLAVTKHVTTFLPQSDRPCREAAGYSAVTCLQHCKADYMQVTCNCTLPTMTYDRPRHTSCTGLRQLTCASHIMGMYRDSDDASGDVCDCPPQCEVVTYEVTPIYVPSDVRSGVEVMVYLKQIEFTQVVQERAYDVWAMLSDVGGALGLFLGSAILTIAQIIDFCIVYFSQRSSKDEVSGEKNKIEHIEM